MPIISSLCLVLALALAVVIGPQMRVWTWGPAMLALGVSVLAALPVFWRRGKFQADFGLLALAALAVAWFAWRAWVSPVAELGHADLLLLCGAVGSFTSIRAINRHLGAERVLYWGIALLLGASAWVIGKQVLDPSFTPVFGARAAGNSVTGFFAHYNYAANYLIASSLLLGGAALFGRHAAATRILWGLLVVAGLAGVYFTKSRGGILGAATGCGILAIAALMVAKRRNAKWFAPAVVAVPLIGLGVAAFLTLGWNQRSGGDTAQLLDNDIRLYLLGVALSCIGLHPLAGGGSRSFSWECYRFFDPQIQRHAGNRPEQVHNELMQAASDYGLVGAGLLVGLIGGLALAAILRILFENRPREIDARDAWRVGALAALAGVLAQSCFSFVFHLIPGAILLGICLGMLSRAEPGPSGPRTLGARVLLTLAATGCALMLLPAGWKGTRATLTLWPSWFSKQPETSAESRIDALTEAIRIWPLSEFYQTRAGIYQELSISQSGDAGFSEPAELAIADYADAERLNSREPGFPINRANLSSRLERDAEAEAAYARGIELQGGMEPGFRGRFSLANHHLRKGLRHLHDGNPESALPSLERAAEEMETAVSMMHWVIGDMQEPRVAIHETLGAAREATGDLDGALTEYNFAATLRNGRRAHYRAGVLIGKMAADAWSKRKPSVAMAGFIEARRRVGQAGKDLPIGVTLDQRAEFIAYLDRTVAFLKGARIQPAE